MHDKNKKTGKPESIPLDYTRVPGKYADINTEILEQSFQDLEDVQDCLYFQDCQGSNIIRIIKVVESLETIKVFKMTI